MIQTAGEQDSNREIIMANTPKFNRSIEGSYFSGSKVQLPVGGQQISTQQQQSLVAQQIPTQSIVVPSQPMMVQQFSPQLSVSIQQQVPSQQQQVQSPFQSQAQFPSQPQIQFPQGRVIQQIVYQNPSAVPSQIVNAFSQKPIVGSIVRMPVENIVVNNGPLSQRSEVKESFIQNRFVNKQVDNAPQQVVIQQQPK